MAVDSARARTKRRVHVGDVPAAVPLRRQTTVPLRATRDCTSRCRDCYWQVDLVLGRPIKELVEGRPTYGAERRLINGKLGGTKPCVKPTHTDADADGDAARTPRRRPTRRRRRTPRPRPRPRSRPRPRPRSRRTPVRRRRPRPRRRRRPQLRRRRRPRRRRPRPARCRARVPTLEWWPASVGCCSPVAQPSPLWHGGVPRARTPSLSRTMKAPGSSDLGAFGCLWSVRCVVAGSV